LLVDPASRLIASRGGRVYFDWPQNLPADVLARFRLPDDIEGKERPMAVSPEKTADAPKGSADRQTAEEVLRNPGYVAHSIGAKALTDD
jgi:hypothetical protein